MLVWLGDNRRSCDGSVDCGQRCMFLVVLPSCWASHVVLKRDHSGHVSVQDMFWFKVLKNPMDEYDNKHRGKKELLDCFRATGLQQGDIFVSDSWKGTQAAIKQLRLDMGWSADDPLYEICNHSADPLP